MNLFVPSDFQYGEGCRFVDKTKVTNKIASSLSVFQSDIRVFICSPLVADEKQLYKMPDDIVWLFLR